MAKYVKKERFQVLPSWAKFCNTCGCQGEHRVSQYSKGFMIMKSVCIFCDTVTLGDKHEYKSYLRERQRR